MSDVKDAILNAAELRMHDVRAGSPDRVAQLEHLAGKACGRVHRIVEAEHVDFVARGAQRFGLAAHEHEMRAGQHAG